jgi:hypothetical protein
VDSPGNGTALRLHGGRTEWISSIRGLRNALKVVGFYMYH